MTLGIHDPFRMIAAWNEDEADAWVTALDRRAASQDQVQLRATMLRLANLRPGSSVVEVGCGTGALLADIAAVVGASGRVVGIEPQPIFARTASERLARQGLAHVEVQTAMAERLALPAGFADACLAQTVLIHLPEAALAAVLGEMARIVRPGGTIVSADQDGDTWIIDHPDRTLTRQIIAFNSDHRYADGWTGRRLARLFRAAGLADPTVVVLPHVDTTPDSYLFGMALRLANAAVAAGAVAPEAGAGWIGQLQELAQQGAFFSSINYYLCAGTRI